MFKLLKQISVRASLLLLLVALYSLPQTGAWFRDQEDSQNNVLVSATLDAVLFSPDPDFQPSPMLAGETSNRMLTVKNVGVLPFKYQLTPEFAPLSNPLCSALNAKLYRLDGATKTLLFNGLLENLKHAPLLLESGMSQEFVMDVSLPINTSLDLINRSCDFDIGLLARQVKFAPKKTGFWDDEVLGNTITSGDWTPNVCSDITGFKRDDSGKGLESWQIIIHPDNSPSAEVVTVAANDADGVTTSTIFDENKIYMLDIANESVTEGTVLLMNGLDITTKTNLVLSQQAGNVFFEIKEPNEANKGRFVITIYDVTDQIVTTDKKGAFGKQVCDPGTYRIAEVPQNGWEQQSPTFPYYSATLPVSNTSYNFVNKQVPHKILINEVYYDVDDNHGKETPVNQADEWVELYNPNNFPVNLKKWTITDNHEERTVSNRNVYIPAHGFAVIVKAAQTFTYWPNIPKSAVLIELGQTLGNGLANSGDRIILKDSLGNDVDAVSWGSDTTAFTPSVDGVAEGHSIQRKELGLDTDTANDWEDEDMPNPGTNPFSNIAVLTKQVDNDLQISFSNAAGFNRVKFYLSYKRLNQYGELILDETAPQEATKPELDLTLKLDPIYLGTCSGTCTPHLDVAEGKVVVMYYLDNRQLGSNEASFSWTDAP